MVNDKRYAAFSAMFGSAAGGALSAIAGADPMGAALGAVGGQVAGSLIHHLLNQPLSETYFQVRKRLGSLDTILSYPGLHNLANAELLSDFVNSSLSSPYHSRKSILSAIKQLDVASISVPSQISFWDEIDFPFDKSWLGTVNDRSIKILKSLDEINISCASIYQAPIAVIKSMKRRHQVNINFDYSYLHGPDQMRHLCQTRKHHFCFLPMAPFFLSDNSINSKYRFLLTCTFNKQHLYRRLHGAKRPLRRVYLLSGSSAEEWHRGYRGSSGTHGLPREGILIQSADIGQIILNDFLDDSTGIVIHEPLALTLENHCAIEKVPGKTTQRWVSMFAHRDLFKSKTLQKILSAFIDVFVAEWNYCRCYPFYSSWLVSSDQYHLNNLRDSSGISLSF